MDYNLYDFTGNIGVALIVVSYLLLQLKKVEGSSLIYSSANALGALLVIVSLTDDFNLSAFVIELFWLVISLIGVVKNFQRGTA